jgi:hypothetical protein
MDGGDASSHFELTRRSVFDEALRSTDGLAFPPSLAFAGDHEPRRHSSQRFGVCVAYVASHKEWGASHSHAGSGTGVQAEATLGLRNGWDASLSVTAVEEGLFSEVDEIAS